MTGPRRAAARGPVGHLTILSPARANVGVADRSVLARLNRP